MSVANISATPVDKLTNGENVPTDILVKISKVLEVQYN